MTTGLSCFNQSQLGEIDNNMNRYFTSQSQKNVNITEIRNPLTQKKLGVQNVAGNSSNRLIVCWLFQNEINFPWLLTCNVLPLEDPTGDICHLPRKVYINLMYPPRIYPVWPITCNISYPQFVLLYIKWILPIYIHTYTMIF